MWRMLLVTCDLANVIQQSSAEFSKSLKQNPAESNKIINKKLRKILQNKKILLTLHSQNGNRQ